MATIDMKAVYLPWVNPSDLSIAMISPVLPDDFDDISWRLNGNDASVKNFFPEEVVFDLVEHHGKKLLDYIPNYHNMLVVSSELKNILLDQAGSSFEFYKVKIRNHKGRIEKREYYVAHLLDSIACMDKKKSDVRTSKIDPTQLSRIKKLTLDKKRIPDDKKIFRLEEMKSLVIVRKDLAFEIFREKNCRGMLFLKMELLGSEFRPLA